MATYDDIPDLPLRMWALLADCVRWQTPLKLNSAFDLAACSDSQSSMKHPVSCSLCGDQRRVTHQSQCVLELSKDLTEIQRCGGHLWSEAERS